MSLLQPWFFLLSGGLAAAVFGLHLLSRRPRAPAAFPTLRFAPPGVAEATELRLRLSDRRLMLLRMAILLLTGLALARPVWPPSGGAARLALIDGSASVARDAAWRAKVAAIAADSDAAFLYGEAPRRIEGDPLGEPPAPGAVGLLSPALIAALREGEKLRERAAQVDLTIVSSFPAAAFDAATAEIRALWPGAIETMRVAPAEPPERELVLHQPGEDSGREKPLWTPREQTETHPGLHAPVATLIAPFKREWRLAEPLAEDLRVVVWWLDGEPAAVERQEAGRIRTWLGFSMPEEGDATTRPSFQRFLGWLEDPRRRPFGMAPVSDEALRAFAAPPAAEVRRPAPPRASPLAPWLLALAMLLALAEPFLSGRLADAGRGAPP